MNFAQCFHDDPYDGESARIEFSSCTSVVIVINNRPYFLERITARIRALWSAKISLVS